MGTREKCVLEDWRWGVLGVEGRQQQPLPRGAGGRAGVQAGKAAGILGWEVGILEYPERRPGHSRHR